MTLYQLITTIQTLASQIPNMNTVDNGDVYVINQRQDIKYKAFVVTQQTHQENLYDKTITYNLYLFEIDRLVSDGSNRLQIQSTAMTDIHGLLSKLEDNYGVIVNSVSYDAFNERFNDLCSGVVANVSLTTNIDDCNNY